ncbi:PucR family transcriptional regulator [Actinomadura verrucosospora]|uniref:Putative PucR family transcriptional regulator n=1 Tax=Actinomadura verrucosospora TaxID=46165 RepID=A0A7D3VWB9_ACTVE|nr:helix-turn-helix domain-containing protein [Actinomadura verrucosospora]QKG24150.1 putative PucR family transcriptional regulator [Actinomadura verrucosospora]
MTQAVLDVRPFEQIPAGLARRMRPLVDGAADGVLADVRRGGPGGVPPGDGRGAARIRAEIAAWLGHFLDLVDDPRGAWGRVAAAHRALGRDMAVRGRDLEEAHRALRRSARAAWRALTALAESLELDRETLGLIADAQFAYMDAVAAEAVRGWEAERPDRGAGEDEARRRRRARLLGLLLAGAGEEEITDAARAARWRVPRGVAAVALHPRTDPGPDGPFPALPPDVLADLVGPEPALVLPDPDGPGRGRLTDGLLRDWIVVIGPTVPPRRAAESMRWARHALAVTRRGHIDGGAVVRCMDHVPLLVIFTAEDLIAHAADSRLAPLRALTRTQADRLAETLLSLLENNFNATEAGNRLHVHPQTVRYRLRHLEELFGADLQDPRRCLELEMILNARARTGALSDA